MDAQQLRELATNALTGHWPKHFGVNTDAERIEFLARKLDAAADDIHSGDEALERVGELETLNEKLKDDLEEAESTISKIRGLI